MSFPMYKPRKGDHSEPPAAPGLCDYSSKTRPLCPVVIRTLGVPLTWVRSSASREPPPTREKGSWPHRQTEPCHHVDSGIGV